jgi:predicted  nucleic acid-binding Zn-ribbon protein
LLLQALEKELVEALEDNESLTCEKAALQQEVQALKEKLRNANAQRSQEVGIVEQVGAVCSFSVDDAVKLTLFPQMEAANFASEKEK